MMPENQLKLSLGSGQHKIDGFKTVDLDASNNPDFLMDAIELKFDLNSIDVIYASHILEHLINNSNLNHQDFLLSIINHWHKLLKNNGALFISVPDIETISQIISENKGHTEIVTSLIEVIYGGNRNQFDHHYFGFTESSLTDLLKKAGFQKVDVFKPFVDDESNHQIKNNHISLNLVAYKTESTDFELPPLKVRDNLTLQQVADQRLEEISRLHLAIKELRESKDEAQLVHNKVEKELLDICQERLDLINKLTGTVNDQHEKLMSKRSIVSKVIDQMKKPKAD